MKVQGRPIFACEECRSTVESHGVDKVGHE